MEVSEVTRHFVANLDGNPELNEQERAITKALPYLIDVDPSSDPSHFYRKSKSGVSPAGVKFLSLMTRKRSWREKSNF